MSATAAYSHLLSGLLQSEVSVASAYTTAPPSFPQEVDSTADLRRRLSHIRRTPPDQQASTARGRISNWQLQAQAAAYSQTPPKPPPDVPHTTTIPPPHPSGRPLSLRCKACFGSMHHALTSPRLQSQDRPDTTPSKSPTHPPLHPYQPTKAGGILSSGTPSPAGSGASLAKAVPPRSHKRPALKPHSQAHKSNPTHPTKLKTPTFPPPSPPPEKPQGQRRLDSPLRPPARHAAPPPAPSAARHGLPPHQQHAQRTPRRVR